MGSPWSLKPKPGYHFENPFSLKVGQIFTGVGVGCGVGIGVGNPINFGAIPALQQMMVATRGATDIFSGVGRQVNNSMKKLGLKHVQAGVGCGIGIGHGFGVGIALKPGVINGIQSSLEGLVSKVMTRIKDMPGISSLQDTTQKATQGVATPSNGSSNINNKIFSTVESETSAKEPLGAFSEFRESTRTEKVLANFLQNPLIQTNTDSNLGETPKNLKDMNNVLQMLIKHQQIIDELKEENVKLREILIDDLKVSPSKLSNKKNKDKVRVYEPSCSDCFECRRRNRKR